MSHLLHYLAENVDHVWVSSRLKVNCNSLGYLSSLVQPKA